MPQVLHDPYSCRCHGLLTRPGSICYIGAGGVCAWRESTVPKVTKINHIGIAANDITAALAVFSDGLGLPVSGSEVVKGDAVRVSFLPVGETRLEILEPVGGEGPVQKFLQSKGQGMHHLCLEVDDLPGMLAQLQLKGVALIDAQPRPGAHGSLVAFLHPRSTAGVLVELVQASGHIPGQHKD